MSSDLIQRYKKECTNDSDPISLVQFGDMTIDELTDIVQLGTGPQKHCYTLDSIYRWISSNPANPTNPMTREIIPPDQVRAIRAAYMARFGGEPETQAQRIERVVNEREERERAEERAMRLTPEYQRWRARERAIERATTPRELFRLQPLVDPRSAQTLVYRGPRYTELVDLYGDPFDGLQGDALDERLAEAEQQIFLHEPSPERTAHHARATAIATTGRFENGESAEQLVNDMRNNTIRQAEQLYPDRNDIKIIWSTVRFMDQRAAERAQRLNLGFNSSGKRRSGKRRSGKRRSGKRLSGKRLSGKRRSGKRRSGKRRSGKRRSGKRLSGKRLSGKRLSGKRRSGKRRSGKRRS